VEGEALRLLEALQLRERVAAEAAVDLRGHERLARREEPLADGVERARPGDEEHLEGVGVGAQGLAHGLVDAPVGGAAVGAHEVGGGLDQPGRPRERQREGPAQVGVGALVGEAPRARPDDGLEHRAGVERRPGGLAAPGEPGLAVLARGELAAGVAHGADAHDEHVDLVGLHLHDAADGALRHGALADDAVDGGDDLGAVGQRDGPRVEVGEVLESEVHGLEVRQATMTPRGSRS
jgi:hypothetical protein